MVLGRDGLGVWPDGRVLGTSPSPSPPPSFGKCPNIRKCTLFRTCLKFPELFIFQKYKPLRERTNIGELFRTYLHKINLFSKKSQNRVSPRKYFFGIVFPYLDIFCPKTKMVRMVHMNISYRMDLEMDDSKSEFWTETQNVGLQKKKKKN